MDPFPEVTPSEDVQSDRSSLLDSLGFSDIDDFDLMDDSLDLPPPPTDQTNTVNVSDEEISPASQQNEVEPAPTPKPDRPQAERKTSHHQVDLPASPAKQGSKKPKTVSINVQKQPRPTDAQGQSTLKSSPLKESAEITAPASTDPSEEAASSDPSFNALEIGHPIFREEDEEIPQAKSFPSSAPLSREKMPSASEGSNPAATSSSEIPPKEQLAPASAEHPKPVPAPVDEVKTIQSKDPEPVPTEEPKPLFSEHTEPVPTGDSNPLFSEQTEPVPTEEPKPLFSEHTEPVPTEEPKPLFSEHTEPVPTGDSKPLFSEHTEPVPTGESKPLFSEQTEPVPTEEPKPLFSEHTEPVPTEEPKPLFSEHTEPVPTGDSNPGFAPLEQTAAIDPISSGILNSRPNQPIQENEEKESVGEVLDSIFPAKAEGVTTEQKENLISQEVDTQDPLHSFSQSESDQEVDLSSVENPVGQDLTDNPESDRELSEQSKVFTDPVKSILEPDPETAAKDEGDLIDLCCPNCGEDLSLKEEHIGVRGACVYCKTPIMAHRFDNGDVGVIRISEEDEIESDSITEDDPFEDVVAEF